MAATIEKHESEPLSPAVQAILPHWQGEVSIKVDTIYSELSHFKSSHDSILDSLRSNLNSDAEFTFQNWRRIFEDRVNGLNQHRIFHQEAAVVSFPWIPFLAVGATILLGAGLFYVSQSLSSAAALKRKQSFV
jgi:hypothetical protein